MSGSEDRQQESRQELGDLIIDYLEQIGVEYIFGVPGGSIEPFYNAMARSARRGGLRPVVARHENGAAFMADGYARETGRLGVCCATAGPGATNMITGVSSAFVDNIPMLVITAQTALPNFGKRALQESSCTAVDTVGLFKHCTIYNTLVSHRGQLEGKLIAAIMAARRSPSGPAHISIPSDLLASPRRMRSGGIRTTTGPGIFFQQYAMVDHPALEALWSYVQQARRIVLVVGYDCAESISEVMAFAELTGALIVCSPQGKRWVHPYHPQFRGVYGLAGHDSAAMALKDEQVDLILAVGSRLDELLLCGGDEQNILNGKLVHIDVASEHFCRSPMARLHVCGRPLSIFEILNRRLRDQQPVAGAAAAVDARDGSNDGAVLPPNLIVNEKEKCFSESDPIKPQRLMTELVRRFPLNARFVCDAGSSWPWATHYLHPHSGGLYRVSMGFGSMCWGIGASVGTAMGCPGTPVVCLTGDGSFLMSGQELTTAVAEKLPVVFVVLNDQALGMVKHGQRLGGGEPIAFELPLVDFSAVARAMGAQGFVVRSAEDFQALDIEAICRHSGPTLLDVHIDPEETPPMGARIRALRGKKGQPVIRTEVSCPAVEEARL